MVFATFYYWSKIRCNYHNTNKRGHCISILCKRKISNLICKLDLDINFPWYADSCYLPENPVVRADVQYALVDSHFPGFPVAPAPAAVHAVAARRLHHRYLALLRGKRDRA